MLDSRTHCHEKNRKGRSVDAGDGSYGLHGKIETTAFELCLSTCSVLEISCTIEMVLTAEAYLA